MPDITDYCNSSVFKLKCA